MDDFVIIHHDRDYLNKCKLIIEEKLNKEYKLELNKKSMIYSSLDGFDRYEKLVQAMCFST